MCKGKNKMLTTWSIQISRELLIIFMLLNLIFRIQSNPLHTEVSSEDIYNDLRALNGSCANVDGCKENRNTGLLRFLNCHCDSSCVELDTCCLESRFRPLGHQPPRDDLECFSGYHGFFHVFMVVNCRRDWIDDGVTARMCLTNGKDSDDPFLDLPVTSLKTGISYKNYFCSICNKDTVDEDQMVAWNILIKGKMNLVTSSTAEYTTKLDKTPIQVNTSQSVTTLTWLEATNPISSRTMVDMSNPNVSPSDKVKSDLLADLNTRQATDLVTSPTIRHLAPGTSPTVKGIPTSLTSQIGQDQYSIEIIPTGRKKRNVVSKPTMRTRNRVIRAVTGETDQMSRRRMPELKYNASLQTWMVQLPNSSTIPVTIKMELPDSAWSVVKTCHPGLISECSINWSDASTAEKCSSYMFLTRVNRNGTTFRYRNPHCAICNHESLDIIDCVEETRFFGMGGSSDLYEAFFVGLFVLEDRKKKCSQGMVYDSFFKKCRVANCPQNHILKDKKCVKENS